MSTVDPFKVLQILLEDDYKLPVTFVELPFEATTCKALMTKFFAIILQDDEFYLSFCLNTASVFEITFFTNILTLVLQNKLVPYVEHFIDIETHKIYFGKHAEMKNNERSNKRKGIKLCPCCDKYFPIEMFRDDNGFCEICNKLTLKKVTFH